MSESVSNPTSASSLLHWLPVLSQQPYWHPEQIKHKPAPEGLKHEQWWPLLKCLRIARWKPLTLTGLGTGKFGLVMTEDMMPVLHAFDTRASISRQSLTGEARERWQTQRISAMMQEAIASVQLSGRPLSRDHCLEMLRHTRQPLHSWDQLVWNLHRLLKTLPETARTPITADGLNETAHKLVERTGITFPDLSAEQLEAFCEFAESDHKQGGEFLHPLLQAVTGGYCISRLLESQDLGPILGRYVMQWIGLRKGYGMLAWTAPSVALAEDPGDYLAAPAKVESDDGDLTYYIQPVLRALNSALVSADRSSRAAEDELLEGRHSWNRFGFLNSRQEDLVMRAMNRPDEAFTIESHREAHGLAYATARADLLRMEQIGLMRKRQSGKSFVFEPAPDWKDKLMRLGDGG